MDFGLTIIGAGRLGGALAIALERAGYQIENVVSRNLNSARQLSRKLNSAPNVFEIANLTHFKFSNVLLIAVPDSEIESTAEKLSRTARFTQTFFLHTSGALSSEILQSLKAAGGITGSMHPLVAVSDAELGAKNFAGAYFCLEGHAAAVKVSERIVAALGGNAFSILPEQKSLYHAAAVISAGHFVALFDLAAETLADCGIEETRARKILLPLVRSATENLINQTPAAALTGTFARADLETMKKHLEALTGKSALEVYAELGRRSLKLAAERGADSTRITAMQRELDKTLK